MSGYFRQAWLICGTLDLLYAVILAMIMGGRANAVLLSVASGPFGGGVAQWGVAGSIAGVAVHFAIMAVMVWVYGQLFRRTPLGSLNPWIAGTLYGLALYGVMYLIVLPLRFPAVHPLTDPAKIALALFPHIVLVGWPMAVIARQRLKRA